MPNMKNCLLSACLLMGLSVSRVVAAETHSGPTSIPALQKAIESILKGTKTPGAAVTIVMSNQVEWLAGIGKADVAANLPVTPDTLFRLGSVSKGFVAVAALQLQEAGKLKLTDTVRQWAPDVAFVNPWEAANPVRLVHLMELDLGATLGRREQLDRDRHQRQPDLSPPNRTRSHFGLSFVGGFNSFRHRVVPCNCFQ